MLSLNAESGRFPRLNDLCPCESADTNCLGSNEVPSSRRALLGDCGSQLDGLLRSAPRLRCLCAPARVRRTARRCWVSSIAGTRSAVRMAPAHGGKAGASALLSARAKLARDAYRFIPRLSPVCAGRGARRRPRCVLRPDEARISPRPEDQARPPPCRRLDWGTHKHGDDQISAFDRPSSREDTSESDRDLIAAADERRAVSLAVRVTCAFAV
jgi:hypothetical protein